MRSRHGRSLTRSSQSEMTSSTTHNAKKHFKVVRMVEDVDQWNDWAWDSLGKFAQGLKGLDPGEDLPVVARHSLAKMLEELEKMKKSSEMITAIAGRFRRNQRRRRDAETTG